MRLIKNWKQTLSAYSTWALTAAAAVPAFWLSVPEEVKALLPTDTLAVVSAIVALSGLAGRFIDQTPPPKIPQMVNPPETSD